MLKRNDHELKEYSNIVPLIKILKTLEKWYLRS